MSAVVEINYWGEGPTDRAAARKLIYVAGGAPGADYSKRRGASPGKGYLDTRLRAFNAAANHSPWLILRDGDGECPAELVQKLLFKPAKYMRLRVVVPSIEAWLLADRQSFAKFLSVDVSKCRDAQSRFSTERSVLSAWRNILVCVRSGTTSFPGRALDAKWGTDIPAG